MIAWRAPATNPAREIPTWFTFHISRCGSRLLAGTTTGPGRHRPLRTVYPCGGVSYKRDGKKVSGTFYRGAALRVLHTKGS